MREQEFDPIRRGQLPYADEINRLQRAVTAASDFNTLLGWTGSHGHAAVPLPKDRFLIKLIAKLDASSGFPNRYSWELMTHDSAGNLLTGYSPEISSDTTGHPAVEVFDRAVGTLPSYQEAWLGHGEYLLFNIGCCGEDCETTVEDFTLRTPNTALPTDRLLVSDPVNHTLNAWQADQMAQLIQATDGFLVAADGPTVTFNLTSSTKHVTTAGGNRTYALSNEYPNAVFTVRTIQNGTGGFAPTFWSGITWRYGAQPPVLPLPNAVTDLTFERTGTGAYRHRGTDYWLS